MEEVDNIPGLGIDARQVWTFECIAAIARQGKVLRTVVFGVLSGDHVLNVKRDKRHGFLRNPAVLAPIPSSTPDQITCGGIHATQTVEPGNGGLSTE